MAPKPGGAGAAGPLKHSTYCVLLALGGGELHGYAIMQAVTEMTDGRGTILPGTLYAALARMLDEGLIQERETRADDASGGPKRRYYKATRHGLATARAESERLHALLDVARKQKILQGVRR